MRKRMKTIGIIGGFGPEATAQFYLKLVKECRTVNNGQQPHVIVWNVSVPRTLEHDALVSGKNLDRFIPLLTTAAQSLEHVGADVVVLPCNTLHVFEPHIRATIHVPFISIVESSINVLQKQKVTRVGLLGSRITVKENLFARSSPETIFSAVEERIQRAIDQALFHFLETQDSQMLRIVLSNACRKFQPQHISDVLIACTDFHCLCPHIPGMTFHDTVDILVKATIQHAVGNP